MKGATAEDSEKTRSTPTRSRNTRIGNNHHFLRTFRNSQSSKIIPILPILVSRKGPIYQNITSATNDAPFCEMTRILGISAYYHDSAACLLEEGPIVAALQEERFSRIKHDSSFPSRSIAAILRIGNCEVSDLDYLVFYENPFVKLERILET